MKKPVKPEKFPCSFCSLKFSRESTLVAHICPKKKRYVERDQPERRIAFNAYCRFYELTQPQAKKVRTIENFIESSLYTDFYKFGRFIYLLNPINPSDYVDFVINSTAPISDWITDKVYNLYLEDFMKREPVRSAIERSLNTMGSWCDENSVEITDFYASVPPGQLTYFLKSGKISPWMLYATDAGLSALSRINDEQMSVVIGIVSPDFWQKKLLRSLEDYQFAQEFLTSVGL